MYTIGPNRVSTILIHIYRSPRHCSPFSIKRSASYNRVYLSIAAAVFIYGYRCSIAISIERTPTSERTIVTIPTALNAANCRSCGLFAICNSNSMPCPDFYPFIYTYSCSVSHFLCNFYCHYIDLDIILRVSVFISVATGHSSDRLIIHHNDLRQWMTKMATHAIESNKALTPFMCVRSCDALR